jgi:hypothetical protein
MAKRKRTNGKVSNSYLHVAPVVLTTNRTYPWLFVTQLFHNSLPSNGGDRKTFGVMTSI